MTTPTPILFIWDGEAMLPIGGVQRKLCDELFVIGSRYRLVEVQDRSPKSHNHYFAALGEAWNNLPELVAERFPTPEHLRKYALIKCGLYDSRSIVAANKTQARELVRFIQPMDEFSIVTAQDNLVTIYTAKSQSARAMSRADFAKSKQEVLDFVASLIGTTPNQLTQNAKEAAQ